MVNDSTVSVIVPVRNRSDLLRNCLQALVDQEWSFDFSEVLVCDDGSTENLRPTIEEFKGQLPNLRLLCQAPKGPAAARNLGILSSDASILVFLDSDVVCSPGFLKLITETLKSHSDWVGAEGSIKPIEGTAGPLWDAPACDRGECYHTAAIAYPRKALVQAGGFDQAFPFPACEDVELAARVLNQGPIGFVYEAAVLHPRRPVTLRSRLLGRKHWKYVMIVAKRYGFLAFPGRRVGRFPRLRVALAAVINLPGGRFLLACKHVGQNPREAVLACLYAVFDVLCGLLALPEILFAPVPPRRNYL